MKKLISMFVMVFMSVTILVGCSTENYYAPQSVSEDDCIIDSSGFDKSDIDIFSSQFEDALIENYGLNENIYVDYGFTGEGMGHYFIEIGLRVDEYIEDSELNAFREKIKNDEDLLNKIKDMNNEAACVYLDAGFLVDNIYIGIVDMNYTRNNAIMAFKTQRLITINDLARGIDEIISNPSLRGLTEIK